MQSIGVSLIVSYYKNLTNLSLILKALHQQSTFNFEVLISEDDSNPETEAFLAKHAEKFNFKIQHLKQLVDDGFRKNSMLNRSIQAANSEKLVFIDGDCIPHKDFIASYLEHIEEGFVFWGRRVMLGDKFSQKLLRDKNVNALRFINLLFSDSKKVKEAIYSPSLRLSNSTKGRGLKGCNWGILRKHLLEINGFDEDYISAAVGEDSDIEWRLTATGVQLKSMKNKAIVYHVHHPRGYSDAGVQKNIAMMEQRIKENAYVCKNGIEKKEN
jgi:glycosyltransferase involved in cell wall biosynthesis